MGYYKGIYGAGIAIKREISNESNLLTKSLPK
jgi:hypothetical protein